MACRSGCCCGSGAINEDNARFLLLALFIVVYLLCGAAVFSALEHPKEREAKERWAQRFEHFSQKYNLSKKELNNFLRNYEEANVAGIRVDAIRPRWDFTGAFYFVGTVVSTIGEMKMRASANSVRYITFVVLLHNQFLGFCFVTHCAFDGFFPFANSKLPHQCVSSALYIPFSRECKDCQGPGSV